MFVLPISGVPVQFRALEGHDELALIESDASSLEARVEAVRRLSPPLDPSYDWSQLPFADVDAALLALRQSMVGDRLIAEMRCSACLARCDTELSISAYLAANRPSRVASLEVHAGGWHEWKGVRFRIPDVASVLEACRLAPHEQSRRLFESCLGADSPEIAAAVSQRSAVPIAAVLQKIAPVLSGEVRGTCPHCSDSVRGWFEPGMFVLAELQSRAGTVLDHVHLLARAYGWSEDMILALPVRRREGYASRILQDQERQL